MTIWKHYIVLKIPTAAVIMNKTFKYLDFLFCYNFSAILSFPWYIDLSEDSFNVMFDENEQTLIKGDFNLIR